jgi:hypothetical protein
VRFVRRGYSGYGRIVTISEIDNTILTYHTLYKFKEDKSSWWYENAFEKLNKEEQKMGEGRIRNFKIGERVTCTFIKGDVTIIESKVDTEDGRFYVEYKFRDDNGSIHGWTSEHYFEKLKARRPYPKKMLDDLGIEKVILSEKRGKAVTYVELKDGRSGKATQDVKDTPDPYVGIAIATLSAMTGSKVNFRNMVDFLVKKGQYIRK